MLDSAKWISYPESGAAERDICPEFVFSFAPKALPVKAVLSITALGVYAAYLNGERVGDFYMAPGWTVYRRRLQVQDYDITELIREKSNILSVTLGGGWYCGDISRALTPSDRRPALLAELSVSYADGRTELYSTDSSWLTRESKTRYADIYNGEIYDSTFDPSVTECQAEERELTKANLIPQIGEKTVIVSRLSPAEIFTTPKGERVVDFGQEITGTASLVLKAPRGTRLRISCAEVLDKDGNFYNENYRDAKSEMVYICGGDEERWLPELSFYGFRYLRFEGVDPRDCSIEALVLCSNIKRTGFLSCGIDKLNRLFENIIWGQRGNFLDIPTDCPQRNERMGWTGDAQVFMNTSLWQFDCKKFYTKWLGDMMLEQRENGAMPEAVPDAFNPPASLGFRSSAAWGDAAAVCPYQLYRHYGDKELLRSHFEMMKKWISFIGSVTDEKYLWTGYDKRQGHFGDWLGLDAPCGSYTGSSDKDLIASAFYYYSTSLTLLAAKALGEDTDKLEELKDGILRAFRLRFPEYKTQTECALALHFGLAEDKKAVSCRLAELIHQNGDCLSTGFVGTPYLLFALSENNYTELAYTLLLQNKFPSWLFSVEQGATTIWEHWDGIKSDGSFWSADMNSFNHYAYGAVASWVFEVAAGITPTKPGFERLRIAPSPDRRLGHLSAEHDTAHGKIISSWRYEGDRVIYEITTPVDATALIDGKEHMLTKGSYRFDCPV